MSSNGASNKCKPPTAPYRPTTERKMAIVLHLRLKDGSPSTTESPRRRRLSATCPVPACLLRRRLPHHPHRRHLHRHRHRHRHHRRRLRRPRLLHRLTFSNAPSAPRKARAAAGTTGTARATTCFTSTCGRTAATPAAASSCSTRRKRVPAAGIPRSAARSILICLRATSSGASRSTRTAASACTSPPTARSSSRTRTAPRTIRST